MYRQTKQRGWATRVALLVALAATLAGCFDLSGQEEETSPFDSPLATPTAEPGVIVITPGEDWREPTSTPWPTVTPQPTPTRRPGPTATPFPTRKPAADASGSIYYAVNKDIPIPDNVSGFHPGQVVYRLPIDGTGLAAGATTALPLPTDTTLIFDSVSPNGRYVLLLEPSEPGGIPYIFDVSTGRIRSLFREYPWAGGRSFGWHPDGRQVLFWSLDVALWLVDADTGEYTVLSQPDGPIQGAAISPDGQTIIYAVSTSFSERAFQMVSAAGGDVQPLFVQNSPTQIFGWSPSGDHILYVGEEVQTKETTSDKPAPVNPLRLMDANGQHQRSLGIPFVLGWSFAPVWSPDGHYIAAAVPTPGEPLPCAEKTGSKPDWENCWYQGTSIYLEDVVTGEVRRLTEGISPVWSPDGRMIAFLSNRSGTSEIWVMSIQDSELHQLTNDGQPKVHTLFWSKEGEGE